MINLRHQEFNYKSCVIPSESSPPAHHGLVDYQINKYNVAIKPNAAASFKLDLHLLPAYPPCIHIQYICRVRNTAWEFK